MSNVSPAWALRALALSYFAMGASALAVIGAVPSIASGLRVDVGAVAALVSVYALVFAFAAPALQVVAGRLPRRTLLLLGLVLSTVGSAASAAATSYHALFLARVVVALGGAAIGPVASALGASLVPPQQQGRALATVFFGMTLASVLSTPAAEWFAAHHGWHGMFAGVAALNAAVAACVLLLVRARDGGNALSMPLLLDQLRRGNVLWGVAVMFLYMTATFATFTVIVPILQQRFHLPREAVSTALLSFGVAGIAGNALAKRLASRWSADRLITGAVGALIAVFAAMSLLPTAPWVPLALLIAWAVANDVFMPSQQRRLAELAPEARGLVLALNASALYLGMAAGSLLAGAVSVRAGLALPPLVSAGLAGASLLALWLSRRAATAAKPPLGCSHTAHTPNGSPP